VATETLRIKVVGLREINKVNTAVNKLDKAMKAINRQRVTGTKAAVKVLRQELSIKNKILKADKEILKTRVEQGKANKKNVVTQTGGSGGSGGFGGGGGGKGSGALSSALISGTFPLLFGQGPLAAAGGFAGGFIGDRLGGKMGGFAGGLVGTATVTILQNAATAIGEVGQAMNPFTRDLDKLVAATGSSNSAVSKQIELIEAAKGKQEAFNVAMKVMESQVGERGVKALQEFGETTRLLGNNIAMAATKLGAFTAGILNFISKITGIQRGLETAETDRIVTAAAATGNKEAQSLLDREKEIEETGFIPGSRGTRRKSGTADKERELELDKKIFAARQKLSIEADSLRTKSAGSLADKQKELKLNERINELVGQGINKSLAKTLATTEQTFDADKKILEGKKKQIEAAFAKSVIEGADAEVQAQLRRDLIGIGEELRDHNKERKDALDLDKKISEATKDIKSNFEMIGESIASGVSDNLTAAIMQTKTLGDAAKSILNDLSSTLIRLGVNTILGNLPGIGSAFSGLPMLNFARGGRPPTGRPSIVGERGPELFVPRRSGTIIPNDKLGGGSTNINVNVDASGSSVEGDEQQSKDLGRAISVAIQSELLKQRRPGGLLR
jgi:hypothetical protein